MNWSLFKVKKVEIIETSLKHDDNILGFSNSSSESSEVESEDETEKEGKLDENYAVVDRITEEPNPSELIPAIKPIEVDPVDDSNVTVKTVQNKVISDIMNGNQPKTTRQFVSNFLI